MGSLRMSIFTGIRLRCSSKLVCSPIPRCQFAASRRRARLVCHNRLVPLVLASAHLGDDEFLEAFHSCRLKTSEFRHADHLRLAWLHLAREPFEIALVRVRSGIQ